jgi:D-threo-aldose 1-dehydrogenase
VRGVGAGINELGMMPRFLDGLDLDFFLVALRYTLMEQDVLNEEFPYASAAMLASSSAACSAQA